MRKVLLVFLLMCLVAEGAWLGYQRSSMPEFAGPTLHVAFIDVRQGCSTLIQTPDGHAALCDAGGPRCGPEVVGFLQRHGVTRLDLLVLSRPMSDHMGGAPKVLDSVTVGHVLDSAAPHNSTLRQKTLEMISARRIPYKTARAGDVFHLGKTATMTILLAPDNPLTRKPSDADNNCIAARVSFGGVSVLLLGDTEPEAEGRLVANNPDLACDVLKVAGHGGPRSISNELLRLTKPAYAVICAGSRDGRRGPSRAMMRRLQAAGARPYRTDRDGTVIVATDGLRVNVTTE